MNSEFDLEEDAPSIKCLIRLNSNNAYGRIYAWLSAIVFEERKKSAYDSFHWVFYYLTFFFVGLQTLLWFIWMPEMMTMLLILYPEHGALWETDEEKSTEIIVNCNVKCESVPPLCLNIVHWTCVACVRLCCGFNIISSNQMKRCPAKTPTVLVFELYTTHYTFICMHISTNSHTHTHTRFAYYVYENAPFVILTRIVVAHWAKTERTAMMTMANDVYHIQNTQYPLHGKILRQSIQIIMIDKNPRSN